MARRVPLTTLSSVAFPDAVEDAVKSAFPLSTTFRDKVEQLATQYGATGEEHPVTLKRKRKAPERKKTTQRRKKQNLDLRTMVKPDKFDIQNFIKKERKPKSKRRASKRTRKCEPQSGFYVNARTTLRSLIKQIPGSGKPLRFCKD